jgi:hypothetical protein
MTFGLRTCAGRRQGLGAYHRGRRFCLKLFAALREDLFAMFDREPPDRYHRVRHRWRQ